MATAIRETYKNGKLSKAEQIEIVEDAATEDAVAVIAAVRDPDAPTPSVEDRLAAIECLLVPPQA